MTALTHSHLDRFDGSVPDRRSIAKTLAPLDRLAACSANLKARPAVSFQFQGERYHLPSYVFLGPQGGDEPIRIGLFAGLHGDEPEGVHALVQFLQQLDINPSLASGFCLYAYPICNPTGFEDRTHLSRRGKDLNAEFWRGSKEPEVCFLEGELRTQQFQGLISLHTDRNSYGLYGYASGAELVKHLIEPALVAAEQVLPRNNCARIAGLPARCGVIRHSSPGSLSAPPGARPTPFEIVLETPKAAPEYLKAAAMAFALQRILEEYRKFIAYAPNL